MTDQTWVWDALNSVGALGAIVVSAIGIRRSPKVVWIVEVDELREHDDGHVWRIEVVNRGRGIATDVRTKTIRHREVIDRAEHLDAGQGEGVQLEVPVDIHFIRNMSNPLQLRGDLEFRMTWRQAPDRIRPRLRTFSPSDRTSTNPRML